MPGTVVADRMGLGVCGVVLGHWFSSDPAAGHLPVRW